jgi:hypothetical protein
MTIGTQGIIGSIKMPEESYEVIELGAHEKIEHVRGFCSLSLEKGSFEIESMFEDEPFHMRRDYVMTLYFTIRAGEKGCKVVLTRTQMKKRY